MFSNRLIGSMFSHAAIIAGAACLLYSCSNAETASQKKAGPKKGAAEQSAATATPSESVSDTAKNKTAQPKENRRLVVYYFMTTYRCPSCHFIEETTRKAIDESFADEIKSGRMIFTMINVEEKGNERFADYYKLYTKTVILSDTRDGRETRWTNLDKVWQLIGNEQRFKAYIVKEVKSYLGA